MRNASSLLLVCCLIASGFAKSAVFLGYQDSLGQYSFGYSAPGSARSEVRTSNGATRGTYSYVDGTGVIQTTQYVADGENGFQVIATNLPQAPLPVQDTPEVMAARMAHLHALELAARRQVEAQNYVEMNLENAWQGAVNPSDANLGRTQPLQPEAAISAGNAPKKDEKSAANVEEEKSKSDSPSVVLSKSGVDKGDKKVPQNVFQAFNRQEVPVFRISHGSHEIEPSAISVSSIAQGHHGGAVGMFTPADTALKKSAAISKEERGEPTTKLKGKEQTQRTANVQVGTAGSTLITPLR